jgi:hypothetical protein
MVKQIGNAARLGFDIEDSPKRKLRHICGFGPANKRLDS